MKLQRGLIEIGHLAAGAGVALVLLAGALWLQTSRLEDCQRETERLEMEAIALRDENEEFARSAERQSGAVALLEQRAAEAEGERDKARAALKASQAQARQRIAELDQAAKGSGSCSDAVRAVRRALGAK